jgi:hypothetical protein
LQVVVVDRLIQQEEVLEELLQLVVVLVLVHYRVHITARQEHQILAEEEVLVVLVELALVAQVVQVL